MILFAASEIYPYAKTGGLADVAHALPGALSKTLPVASVMPLYHDVDRTKHAITDTGYSFDVLLQDVAHQVDIFIDTKTQTYFLYNPILCDRQGLYFDAYGEFGDNDLRFGIFNYAILQMIEVLDLPITTLHLNDWQTALAALLSKDKLDKPYKVILTIHNLAYQGVFDKAAMGALELDWHRYFKPEIMEYYDNVNFLKAGIYYCDELTTVSQTYAKQIQTPEFGCDLQDMLARHSDKLKGITNGISYEVFDPGSDDALYVGYDSSHYYKKEYNKKKLCKAYGLKRSKRPLFVFIGRLTPQKGIELLLENIPKLARLEANFFILGSGDEAYNAKFTSFGKRYENINITVGYDETLSRRLYAAADFLLMPSIFEPCGLNQMIAMHYGTVPIVTDTGGLADTVTDYGAEQSGDNSGTGIVMERIDAEELFTATARALALYGLKKRREKLAKANMRLDFSWDKRAKKYISLYR